MIKHNCCKDKEIEWRSAGITGKEADIIKCRICGRRFKEIVEEDLKKWIGLKKRNVFA